MGAFHSVPEDHHYRGLSEKTGFSQEQIKILHNRFRQLSHNDDVLRRDDLHTIPDLASNPIRSQIVAAFFDKRNFQKAGEGSVQEIGFEEFLIVMSYFRPPSVHMTEKQIEETRRSKLRFLFNMHDTDNDGAITLEEYKHLGTPGKTSYGSITKRRSQKVVEELLSKSGSLERETAKGIADAAMLEVASISVGYMGPDEFYGRITFEHFVKILSGIEIETRMHIRFLNVGTMCLCK